ncbi:GDSL-type esterase/lipase family protein [Paenibacillus sp. P96]|uniref:GDSL-type esterase/lipase family protein n=1 Tax=Paenibacillus zeirhizosphaerae TaxID=2987519 RepID=A0ABT9FSN2_9BACL|nr:GDSL-type esterase/lipase family protein [Paenibacillus sp. P96]MDP4097690.1 GDSL-type esterase/lipase family protein [Paenibacillus sp. P96]
MNKKIVMTLLMGGLSLTLAACGSQTPDGTAQQPALQAQEQGDVGATAPESTANSYQQIFQNSVFFGDSITEGLSFHDVLDEKNVLAGAGKTAQFALEDIDELTKRNPKQVFIQLGSDDILWPTDDPVAYSMNNYAKLIGLIKEKLPQARITLLTVTPVSEEALKKEPRYKNIGDYNQAVKELADKEQVEFTDLSPLFSSSADVYDSDGIHFKPEFYVQMLELLRQQVK